MSDDSGWEPKRAVRRRTRGGQGVVVVTPVEAPKQQQQQRQQTQQRRRRRCLGGPRVIEERACAVGDVGAGRVGLYVPQHVRCALTAVEVETLSNAGEELSRRSLEGLMESLGMPDRVDECAAAVGHGASAVDVAAWISRDRLQNDRTPAPALPLPPCCENLACFASPNAPPPDSSSNRELYTLYVGWTRKEGSITATVAFRMLQTCGYQAAYEDVSRVFEEVDVGSKGALAFHEFCALLANLNATDLVLKKRARACATSSEEYQQDLALFRHHYEAFDLSGDGRLDFDELRAALHELGFDVSVRRLRQLMADVTNGESINFGEFLRLMRRFDVRRDNLNAIIAKRGGGCVGTAALLAHFQALAIPPIGVHDLRLADLPRKGPTIEAVILGSSLRGTPYANALLRLHVQASPGYPLQPPVAFFSRRLFHLNFDIALDGTTHLAQLLHKWDATWRLKTLLQRVCALLRDPDPNLLPPDLYAGTRYDVTLADPRKALAHPPGYDLRTKKAQNKLTAEVAHLFHKRRAHYDALAKAFADRHLEPFDDASYRPDK
ncbi:hypothetical protein CTAYLR_006866 [Chrysophaeum taylorii]|uniref:Calmodulin n=1 Tax=Chrysophaeum taylorii TaxID=2483200 RepID=A0AAD7U5I1_9STRA|nr:hypothetical protein CTAYLR_006866 [Chrysophaeum taylorii]